MGKTCLVANCSATLELALLDLNQSLIYMNDTYTFTLCHV
jgi:hypothetical protein